MKFSVNWLSEFIADLPKDAEDIADLLTRAGVETENIEKRGAKIDNVIVSQIKESSRHPNADRLTVCEVDDGSGTKRQIVCGATNYEVCDKVPLALPGAKLPNGTEIRKSQLRGVESEGMLCSAIELGLGSDAAGLLILSPEAKIGAPIFASGERINRPAASDPRPSSIALQSIPSLSTPRSWLFRISVPFGNFAPGSASGTLSPTS